MKRLATKVGAIGLSLIVPTGVALAQGAGEDGGVSFELTLSETIRASDNLDLEDPAVSGVRSVTGLDGAFRSVTRQQSFELGFSAAGELDNDGFELGDTGLSATYIRMGANGEFELNARYFNRDVTSEFEDDGLGTIITSGTQIDYGYGTRLLLGKNGPLTAEIVARQDEREFDSADPDAVDSTTARISTDLTAKLDPATTGRLTFSFVERAEDNAANAIDATTRIGAGISRDLSETTTVSADVDWTRLALTDTGVTTVVEGLAGTLAFERDLLAGSFSASARRTVSQNGSIDELRLARQIEFPTTSLFLEGGLVITDGDTVSPLLGLGVTRDLRDGRLRLNLSQAAGIDGDDQTVLSTSADASWQRDINAVSSLSANVGYQSSSAIAGGDNTNRLDAGLTYRRQLTETTDLTAGYEYAIVSETGENDRSSNTVFVTFSKSFSARP